MAALTRIEGVRAMLSLVLVAQAWLLSDAGHMALSAACWVIGVANAALGLWNTFTDSR